MRGDSILVDGEHRALADVVISPECDVEFVER